MKNILFLLIMVAVSVTSCIPDPATKEALEVSKQIKDAQDSLDAQINRAEEIIQEMRDSDSSKKIPEISFDSIQPLGEAPDSVLRAIGIEVE